MLVKSWMTSNVVTVAEGEVMMKAAAVMNQQGIHALPVVANDKLVGIITDRDIKGAAPSQATSLAVHELNYLLSKITVKDLMSENPVFVKPDETVEFAAVLMLRNKIHALPVVEDGGKLAGIITQTDVFRAMVEITGVMRGNLQIALSLEDQPGKIKDATDVIRFFGGRIVSILSSREGTEPGVQNVFIRIRDMETDKLRELVDTLERKYIVLYTVRDVLEHVQIRSAARSGKTKKSRKMAS